MSRPDASRRSTEPAASSFCAECGRPSMPLFPCCPPRAPRAPTPAEVDWGVVHAAVLTIKHVGFEIMRPAGPWGARDGLSFAKTLSEAAHAMLMFSGGSVLDAYLPELERVLEDEDGQRHNVAPTTEDLVGVAVAAASGEHRMKFPGRLHRLVATRRLPRCG